MPVDDALVDGFRVRVGRQGRAHRFVREQLGDLRQDLEVLLEAAVRNTILQLRGIDTLQEFMERQRQAMSGD